MIGLEHYLILSGAIFVIGLYGALSKKNVITVLMSIELMFNGVNIALVALSRFVVPWALTSQSGGVMAQAVPFLLTGQIFAIFVITVAAAEVALGLGLVMVIYRHRESVDLTQVSLMRR